VNKKMMKKKKKKKRHGKCGRSYWRFKKNYTQDLVLSPIDVTFSTKKMTEILRTVHLPYGATAGSPVPSSSVRKQNVQIKC